MTTPHANAPEVQAPDEAFFHAESDTVRFWVPVEGRNMGAIISRQTLHYTFRPGVQGDEPLQTYASHLNDIHAAVRRRVAEGSLEPVMLREYDLRAGPP